MAANQLRIDGLKELRASLLNLPAALVHESAAIVQAHGAEAARKLAAVYQAHSRSGNLLRHLHAEYHQDAVSSRVHLRNTAHHAWMFENGTVPRFYKGWPRGSMKKNRTVADTAVAQRRLMEHALIDVVRRAGLTVTVT